MSEQYVKGAIPSDCSGLSFGLHVGVERILQNPKEMFHEILSCSCLFSLFFFWTFQ